jgi:DNA mismatch repair protein MSH2
MLFSDDRLNIVESLVSDISLRQSLRGNHLNRLPDLQRLAGRLQRRRAGLQDCYRLYQAVGLLPELLEALETSEAAAQQQALYKELFTNPLKVPFLWQLLKIQRPLCNSLLHILFFLLAMYVLS